MSNCWRRCPTPTSLWIWKPGGALNLIQCFVNSDNKKDENKWMKSKISPSRLKKKLSAEDYILCPNPHHQKLQLSNEELAHTYCYIFTNMINFPPELLLAISS